MDANQACTIRPVVQAFRHAVDDWPRRHRWCGGNAAVFRFMKTVESWLSTLSGWVWGPPLLIALLGTHLFLTFRLGCIQRFLGRGIRLSVARDPEAPGDISQFGALTTALAATIGTGNIIGVATAIAAGGPGAVLWMWLTGVFGIATKYAEAVLAIQYRVTRENGEFAGGPMYVLERGLGWKWLGVVFAALTVCAGFGIGNMVQSNAIVGLAQETLPNMNPVTVAWSCGLVLAVATGATILGGIHSIARVSQTLVPFMAVVYVLGCIALLVMRADAIPGTIVLIVKSAFTGQAAVGGFLGAGVMAAMRFGVARGLFSNESGLGSAPIAAAAARTSNPVRQGLVSATGTFWDTVVICALTGLVVVSGGGWQQGLKGAALAKASFADLHALAPLVLSLSLLLFVFTTIIGWAYYAEKAIEYLVGTRAVRPFRCCWVVAVLVGSVVSAQAVWDFADVANGLMAVPNLVALLALHGVVVAETRARADELRGG
jgi:AGCS family alanine or glycine:cation symporter